MSCYAVGSRGWFLLSLILLWALVGASGCATVSSELEKGYHAVAQEEYYLKRQSKLYARPDRSSAERGYAQVGDKVVKLEGDVRGWSKVKVERSGLEGWLPASALSSRKVSPAAAKPKAASKTPAKAPAATPTPAPAAAKPAPAEKKSGSILSPPSAEAAETPPPAKETPPKRKADPKKFEAL